ncbi:MAG: exodeoxyribonuclease V subunit gamma [Planctomycetota bacterium]
MDFLLHQNHRLEELLAALAHDLAADPSPPLVTETILVPGPGLARWVQLRLAERFGIAAGLRLPFLGAFLQELASTAVPLGADAFDRDVLVWRLWRLLGQTTLREELGQAALYCGTDPDGSKRFQLCSRLATCFDDYQLYRDDVLLAFARGEDCKQLGPHAVWQAHLWRALLRDADMTLPAAPQRPRRGGKSEATPLLFPEIANDDEVLSMDAIPSAHRLERLRRSLADPARARAILPPRVFVFGAGTLPPAFARLLQMIAVHVPVRLYVPSPTPHYTGDLRAKGEQVGGNALLARFGGESREFADLLLDLEAPPPPLPPLHCFDEEPPLAAENEPGSLLQCVQRDIVEVLDRGRPGGPTSFRVAPGDSSLHVHDCHSPQRELEVVRDQILAAFQEGVAPHEVLVLVPDIARYAPYAHAVFGPLADCLPFHLADRSATGDLPICASLMAILQLAHDRLRAVDVLHVLEQPAIQRRFGLTASDLPTLRRSCQRAGIRWGLDADSRAARFDLPPFGDNAWLPGLQRLLLGIATGPSDDLIAGVLPVADVTEGRREQLARFVHFAHTLFGCIEPLHAPHALTEWASLLDALVEKLFAPAGGDDDTAIALLRAATAKLRSLAAQARHSESVHPTVLRDWLTEALQQSTGARGFLAGAVTVAALLPMRTVPARCLFVCGLDDASFPRRDQPVPFDLIAQKRRSGDRSRRLDDRQTFLDVLLAARERLHLTFVGHSAKDDAECAPSVVLAELLDHLDRTCVAPPGFATPRDYVLVRQPLQPWSTRYRSGDDARLFTFVRRPEPEAAVLAAEAPWFRPEAAVARAPVVSAPVVGARVDGTPVDADQAEPEPIALERLLAFWWHPCRFFLQQSLRLRVRASDDREDDAEPFAIHNLDKYLLQDGAVRSAMRGENPPSDAEALARATGMLPVGWHGTAVHATIAAETEQFLHTAQTFRVTGRRVLNVRGADFAIAGEVDGLGPAEMVRMRIARLKPKDRLKGWLLHLFVAAARQQGATGLPLQTRLIGKDKSNLLLAPDPEIVTTQLALLVEGYRRGQQEPLPFFERSSHAYGAALYSGRDPAAALRTARREWSPNTNPDNPVPHDSEDPHIQLCMRGRDPVAEPAFADWARAVWEPACSFLRDV